LAIETTQVEEQQGLTPYFGLAIERILAYFILLNWLPVETAWARVAGRSDGRLSSAVRRQIANCLTGQSDNIEFELSAGIRFLKRGGRVWIFQEPAQLPETPVGLGQFYFENVNRSLGLDVVETCLQGSADHLLDKKVLNGQLCVRHWQPGDRIRPAGRREMKVSDYLCALKLNPIERRRTVVLADERGSLVILGRAYDERALVKNNTTHGIKVTWKETCRT
jgi:tRNA(Ile)-lysidine synthetase-like protein